MYAPGWIVHEWPGFAMKLGILGGGQLGRMLAIAGFQHAVTCRFLEPASESVAAATGERIRGEFEDFAALYEFAQGLSKITYEFENVPVESVRWLNERVPVRPGPEILAVAQDRLAEKNFFASQGIPVPGYRAVHTRQDLENALQVLGFPAVLKTTRFGYDGKGQAIIQSSQDIDCCWQKLSGRPLILEQFVAFDRELSILAVRSSQGQLAFYPLCENHHQHGILRWSRSPIVPAMNALQKRAEDLARTTLEYFNYVGVLAIELFDVGGELLVNEMAPRVHNSGHWTIEGAETSQFENHLRAVLGWPLGRTNALGHSFMYNLIGQIPDVTQILKLPAVHYHNYGKTARTGRKLGHITIRAQNVDDLHGLTQEIELVLGK